MVKLRKSALGEDKPRTKLQSKKVLLACLVILILIAGVGTAGYFYNKYQESKKELVRLSDPQEASKAQVEQMVTRVSALTDLPGGETPTLATVVDIKQLKDQAFFVNAQNGDRVLIYYSAKKAYLYRPSTNKIINIAPVNIGGGQTQ